MLWYLILFTVHLMARQVRDSVQWIYSEPMLIYYVQLFRDAYWPEGQLAAAAELPTELQKLQMRSQAKSALLRNIPGLYCDILRVKGRQRIWSHDAIAIFCVYNIT